MAKLTLRGAARRSLRGWGAVLTGGLLLAVLALLDAPHDGTATVAGGAGGAGAASTADGSTGCQLQVIAAELKVRSGPSIETDPLETLRQGALVDGTTQITDGFRLLEGDRWAADEFLVPVAGTAC